MTEDKRNANAIKKQEPFAGCLYTYLRIQCRNYRLRPNPFVFTVRRCAVGWGMPHPYTRLS